MTNTIITNRIKLALRREIEKETKSKINDLDLAGIPKEEISLMLHLPIERVEYLIQIERKKRKYVRGHYKKRPGCAVRRKINSFIKGKEQREALTKSFIEKYGTKAICYLTGKELDLTDGKAFQIDHVKALKKGGSSELDNLRPTYPIANLIKRDLELNEFIELCRLIANNFQSSVAEYASASRASTR